MRSEIQLNRFYYQQMVNFKNPGVPSQMNTCAEAVTQVKGDAGAITLVERSKIRDFSGVVLAGTVVFFALESLEVRIIERNHLSGSCSESTAPPLRIWSSAWRTALPVTGIPFSDGVRAIGQ